MKIMEAVCICSYGRPGVLVHEDVPRPHPGEGEVLVRIHAAGINPVDWKIREGHLKEMLQPTFPLVLGWDFSGVVESLGSGLTLLKAGDEVFSRPDIARDGAYAEFIAVKESEVGLEPKSVDHIHEAAMPLAGLTAGQTLFDAGGLSSGQRVLIHAAAGGVGHLAVQLAKWKGAHVIGTAAARDHDFLCKLGVDQVIDCDTERFEDVVQPVDVVLDTMGGDTQERSWKVVKPGGILVSVASPPKAENAAKHGVRRAFVFTQPNAARPGEIAKLADAKKAQGGRGDDPAAFRRDPRPGTERTGPRPGQDRAPRSLPTARIFFDQPRRRMARDKFYVLRQPDAHAGLRAGRPAGAFFARCRGPAYRRASENAPLLSPFRPDRRASKDGAAELFFEEGALEEIRRIEHYRRHLGVVRRALPLVCEPRREADRQNIDLLFPGYPETPDVPDGKIPAKHA